MFKKSPTTFFELTVACGYGSLRSPGRRGIWITHEHQANPTARRQRASHRRQGRRGRSIENHPENWIAFVLFWALAFIVFLQFFTRYVLNDSLAWTEEIARYGLMWLAFIGGAVVTRKKTHIAVELLGNLMKPSLLRTALFAMVDFVTLGFIGAAGLVLGLHHRAHADQTMTVFDLPMSYVYGGVALRLLHDAGAPGHGGLDATPARAGSRPHDHQQIPAD